MSELGYGSPKENPLPLRTNNQIVSYLMGSYASSTKRKTFIGNIMDMFTSKAKSFLVAFTDENIVIGKLEKGNISSNENIVSYKQINAFNYYNKSGNLEIVTDKNQRYLIKVSKYELSHTMKHIDKSLDLKYLD